ncbi:MAG TPA: phosphoribosylaminoimidazolesuccinocarboxamide synthase [Actinomycetaceae bacterium]|nr:phosphoribosylaminoimidazolesuccinocarboxamide synthase [Actinomycetaceae bacterium]
MTGAPVLAGWTHVYSGKVRDLYVPAEDHPAGDVVLVVASDRISAYDHVLPTLIPGKGEVLTRLSVWWFDQLADLVPGHVVSLDVPAEVAGRAMVCRRLEMFPVECVARGYLTGSGLVEYREGKAVCGVPLPAGLGEASRLPEPIFTPAAKAQVGEHDENITFDRVEEMVGAERAAELRDLTLAIYARAAEVAERSGIIVADTKLEFGLAPDGTLVLADEVLTPDSSRFWPADQYVPGRVQPSFDKQDVRDWLVSSAAGWDRSSDSPPPALPPEVVERTRARYVEVAERLIG